MVGQTNKQSGFKPVQLNMTQLVMGNSVNVVRIIAKDHGLTLEGGEFVQVGTISLNCGQYFKDQINFGTKFQQWITLFDDTEDDEFDGDLGENDEELPMILTHMTVEKA